MQQFGGTGGLIYPALAGIGGLAYGALAPYGTLNLTATSPPQSFDEPLQLDEVKAYLNLPGRSPVDNDEDQTLLTFISAARELAEIFQGRDLVQKQYDLSLDYFFNYQIPLRDPLISVDLVQYKDYTGLVTPLVQNTDYIADTSKHPGLVMPVYNTTWPTFTAWPSSSVLIRFTSGYATTDAFWSDAGYRIKLGMKYVISAWYNNRLPFAEVRTVQEYPMAVTALLSYGQRERVW